MSETSKYLIFLVVLQALLFVYLGFESYTSSICKAELGKTSHTIGEIEKLCK